MKTQLKVAIITGIAMIIGAAITVGPDLLKMENNTQQESETQVRGNLDQTTSNKSGGVSNQSRINQNTAGTSSPAVVSQGSGDVNINIGN